MIKRLGMLGCAMLLSIFGASQALGHGGGDSMGDWDSSDICGVQKGHYNVHFTAYQEKVGAGMLPMLHEVGSAKVKKEFQSYCEGVPETGKFSMAFDLYHEELRKLPISVRIVEAVEAHEDAGGSEHSHAILSLPPIVYGDGTVKIATEIPKAGHYLALLTLEEVGPGITHTPHRGTELGGLQLVTHTHGQEPTEAEMHAVDPTFSFPFSVGLEVKARSRLPWFFSNLGFQVASMLLGAFALVMGVRYYMNGKWKKQP